MRVLVCGSCRVGKPCRKAAGPGEVVINVANVLAFSHSAPEALQQLRMLRGELAQPPDALKPYLTAQLPWVERADTQADACILEVCTRKLYVVEGWLIPHRSLAALTEAGIPFDTHEMTDSEVVESVAEFKGYMAPVPVLLVTHVDAKFPRVGRLRKRTELVNLVAGIGGAVLNPSPQVEAWGVDRACTDESHYSPEFERHIGRALLDRCKLLGRQPV